MSWIFADRLINRGTDDSDADKNELTYVGIRDQRSKEPEKHSIREYNLD